MAQFIAATYLQYLPTNLRSRTQYLYALLALVINLNQMTVSPKNIIFIMWMYCTVHEPYLW